VHRLAVLLALVVLAVGLMAFPAHLIPRPAITGDFVHFESPHVHPAVLTPSGDRILVVNTPDNRLSVFDVTGQQPVRIAEIPVGLEPVSVAALDDSTAWVVNNLSDDVSVVDLTTMHVKATLEVGDEPNDVVFAGSPRRAYVSVSQEDRIRVYNPARLADAPVDIPIDGRYPRALATNASGTLVYAAVLFAGNRTSVLSFQEVPPDSQPVDPSFPRDPQLTLDHGPAPRVGLIVQQQGNDWRDMYGKLWNHRIPYRQHDVDVAEIPAGGTSASRTFDGLAAINFAITVSPIDGTIAIAGTDARNLLRFEPRLRGHFVDTRVGLVTTGGGKTLVDLNPHVDYDGPGTQAERDSALGLPTGIAYAGDGQRVYVTSLASDKLGVLDPATGAIVARVGTVPGPTGVVVDDGRGRIYVVGRFRNQLQTLSSADLHEVARTGIGFDPTPDEIVNGRKFFYGGFTSAHGDEACASCHLFGDFDNLAWDLGDPRGQFHAPPVGMDDSFLEGFDPMKGPMTTQSLRGLPGTGRLHWRADRENLAAFNPAFVNLMGRTSQLPDSEMAAFSDFVLALAYPPNPALHLDRSFPDAPAGQPSAKRGKQLFGSIAIDNDHTCDFCHSRPTGTNRQIINDAALSEDQDMKVPHLRNLYKKTGFADAPGAVTKRGFGFSHDGSFASVFDFLKLPQFNFDPGTAGDLDRRDVEAFVLAFDTGMAPAVGRRMTFDAANRSDARLIASVDTLRARAQAGDCDLVAHGRVHGQPRSWWYQVDGSWRSDKLGEAVASTAALLDLAGARSELTITGVPLGSGERMGNDRDRDGHRDGDELDGGSDPGDPASTPPPRVNRAPSVDAGLDQTITRPAGASLRGLVTDDGLPSPPGTTTHVWRRLSGPGTVIFGDSLAAVTTASFSRSGTYGLSLTASDGALAASDAVTILASAPGICTAVIDRLVAAGADDAEEKLSGSVSPTSSDLELIYDGGVQTVGLRFTGIAIPQGSTITSAYVQFTADEAQSEATTLTIQAQDADSALAFTTATRNVSSRPRTDAAVTWRPGSWAVNAAGLDQRTPDLSSVIQELVDRPAWQGRSLALVVSGSGHRTAKAFEASRTTAPRLHIEVSCDGGNLRPSVDAGPDQTLTLPAAGTLNALVSDDGLPVPPGRLTQVWRKVSGPDAVSFGDSLAARTSASFSQAGTYVLRLTAFDGSLTASDDLTLVVRPPGGVPQILERPVASGADDAEEKLSGSVSLTSSDLELIYDGGVQIVGLRFSRIDVPRSSTITSAWIQFTADEAQSEATSLRIEGHDADNAATFTTATRNVSSRPRTGASVAWAPAAWTVVGETGTRQRTPDLTAIVQAIVARPGWTSGNAVAFVITGSGHRTARAFEGKPAAVLHVEFTSTAPAAPSAEPGAVGASRRPPEVTGLGTVFPNPGPGPATIRFELARPADVRLEIFDLRGALVRRIVSGRLDAGRYTQAWDGRDGAGRRLPRGVYLVGFAATGHRETRKLIVLY
jgi:YVTN family beta-propeller protein